MLAFGAISMIGLPYWIANKAMDRTHGYHMGSELENKLRARASIDSEILAKAQRERLQVLLDETRNGEGSGRYAAALDGKSLGTHSSGTSANAVAIKQN